MKQGFWFRLDWIFSHWENVLCFAVAWLFFSSCLSANSEVICLLQCKVEPIDVICTQIWTFSASSNIYETIEQRLRKPCWQPQIKFEVLYCNQIKAHKSAKNVCKYCRVILICWQCDRLVPTRRNTFSHVVEKEKNPFLTTRHRIKLPSWIVVLFEIARNLRCGVFEIGVRRLFSFFFYLMWKNVMWRWRILNLDGHQLGDLVVKWHRRLSELTRSRTERRFVV